MHDGVRGDVTLGHHNSAEEFENTSIEDIMPVYEEITTMKTEVIEEYYDYGTLDGVESEDATPFSASEHFQSATDEHPAIPSYEQTLKNDCYEQRIVSCKERNKFRLSKDDAAAKDGKTYACDKCSFITKYISNFQRHTLVHGDEKPFKCKTCGSSFKENDGLKKHVRIHDNERQKDVHCSHCNKTYYRNASLQRHIKVKHTYKKYKCRLCDYATSYKYFLKQHELIKHSDRDKSYKCMYCEHSTHYKMFMENHEPTCSNASLLECTYKNFMSEQQAVSKTEKSCDCNSCQFETSSKDSMRRHILATHRAKAKRHTCPVCTYSTEFQSYLRYHMRIHTVPEESPKKYKCKYCDHTTHRKWNLDQHTLIHTNKKIFKCTYINCKSDCIAEKLCDCEMCGYQTVYKSALKRHMLTKHSGEEAKEHTCTYCNYSTNVKGDLEGHLLRKHANEKFITSETS